MRYRSQLLLTVLLGGTFQLSLSGCAPSTAGGVREMGPERQFTFVAPEGYQLVYRKILDQERKCWQATAIGGQMVVQGDLFSDTKSGTITLALHGAFGVDTYQVIDVSALSEQQTKVVGFYAAGPVNKYGLALKEWVLENSKECGPKK